jgi:hypothetical protein
MNNYLLTIIGEFQTKEMCKSIAVSLTPIVDSPSLKFHYTKNTLVFHFSSEVSQVEIADYTRGILFGISDFFILNKMTDDVSVSMPQDVSNHLFDLETMGEDVDMILDMNRIKNNLDFMDQEENDFVALLLDEMSEQNYIKRPSLDQILDKVLSNGMGSLSQFEKDILETYSK